MNEFYVESEYEQRIRDLQLALDGAMKKLAAVEAERDTLREQMAYLRDFEDGFRKTFGKLGLTTDPNVVRQLFEKNEVLYHRAERAERILAALREPSDFVIEAIDATAWERGCARLGLPACALVARAAVAAAEREVGGE